MASLDKPFLVKLILSSPDILTAPLARGTQTWHTVGWILQKTSVLNKPRQTEGICGPGFIPSNCDTYSNFKQFQVYKKKVMMPLCIPYISLLQKY